MIYYITFGITYAFAAAVQPGPLFTYLLSRSISKGWRHTLPASLAPLISDGPIIILVLLLLTNVPNSFINILQLAGGLFLLYLSYGAMKSWKEFDAEKIADKNSCAKSLFTATVVNFLNPSPYIGWSLVMGPLLLKGWRESPANGISLLVSFYGTLVVCLAVMIIIFGSLKKLPANVSRSLLGLSFIALACLGIYDLWIGAKIYF
ncbi:MAG: LysE family transporter [Bacteroidetes bacterium]|nr:LysE family transporter [Bacteroidota bacterium]